MKRYPPLSFLSSCLRLLIPPFSSDLVSLLFDARWWYDSWRPEFLSRGYEIGGGGTGYASEDGDRFEALMGDQSVDDQGPLREPWLPTLPILSSRCFRKVNKSNCDDFGSLCYDPRFVGGDGVMFYFHGATGGNFAIVSDDEFQINAHFIGTRPQGRTRDYTWVQALSVMFDSHTLVIAANRVTQWNENVESLSVKWDGELVSIPTDFIEGVLGQTYRPSYVSPVKRGVAMPMMGGEDKYQTPSLFSTSCKLCRFQRPSTSQELIAQY